MGAFPTEAFFDTGTLVGGGGGLFSATLTVCWEVEVASGLVFFFLVKAADPGPAIESFERTIWRAEITVEFTLVDLENNDKQNRKDRLNSYLEC